MGLDLWSLDPNLVDVHRNGATGGRPAGWTGFPRGRASFTLWGRTDFRAGRAFPYMSTTPQIEFESLLRHDDFVRGLARSLLGRDPRAEDVAQDAWVAAAEGGPRSADSAPEVRAAAHVVCRNGGGQGAVREVCERILKARGAWQV